MSAKEEFIELFQEHIHRDGAEALLDYLTNKCDFFTAPASARYHGAYAGGLCEHSLNVYHCLADYLAREGIAVRGGLHCAPGAHRFLGTLERGAVRASVGHETTFEDVEALLRAVKKMLRET